MLQRFRFWLAWLLMPTEDKFRSHYYLMFWQEACFWHQKQWRKVHKRALIRANADFGRAEEMAQTVDASIQAEYVKRAISR